MRRTALLLSALLLVTAGCATEVIDSTLVSTTTLTATPTRSESLAGADLDQLTTVLRDEVTALSTAVFESDKSAARTHLDRINEAWSYAEPLIVAKFGELADQINYDLRRVINLARSAVERNRPADASKALLFLQLALQSLNG